MLHYLKTLYRVNIEIVSFFPSPLPKPPTNYNDCCESSAESPFLGELYRYIWTIPKDSLLFLSLSCTSSKKPYTKATLLGKRELLFTSPFTLFLSITMMGASPRSHATDKARTQASSSHREAISLPIAQPPQAPNDTIALIPTVRTLHNKRNGRSSFWSLN